MKSKSYSVTPNNKTTEFKSSTILTFHIHILCKYFIQHHLMLSLFVLVTLKFLLYHALSFHQSNTTVIYHQLVKGTSLQITPSNSVLRSALLYKTFVHSYMHTNMHSSNQLGALWAQFLNIGDIENVQLNICFRVENAETQRF